MGGNLSSDSTQKENNVSVLSKDKVKVQNVCKNVAVARGNDTTLIYRKGDTISSTLFSKNDEFVSFHDDSEVQGIKVFDKPLKEGENIKIEKKKNSDYIYFIGGTNTKASKY